MWWKTHVEPQRAAEIGSRSIDHLKNSVNHRETSYFPFILGNCAHKSNTAGLLFEEILQPVITNSCFHRGTHVVVAVKHMQMFVSAEQSSCLFARLISVCQRWTLRQRHCRFYVCVFLSLLLNPVTSDGSVYTLCPQNSSLFGSHSLLLQEAKVGMEVKRVCVCVCEGVCLYSFMPTG